MSGGVLEEHGGETLDGSERCAVDHDRTLLGAVGIGIFKLETLRQVVVDLDGTQLPLAAEGVLDHEVQFRAIEGGLAVFGNGRKTLLGGRLDDGLLRAVPVLLTADILLAVDLVTQGDLRGVSVELEDLEDIEDQVDDLLEFLLELLRTDEHVGVVLGEAADAGQSVEFAALLIPVNGTEFGEADRQVTVGTRGTAENFAVVRAVHRLEHVLFAFLRGMDRLEGILAVLGIVAGSHIQLLATDMRSDDLLVAVFIQFATEEFLQFITHDGTAREPERQTHADTGREHEQFHLLAEFAVVPLLGFFEDNEILVEHGFLREGDAVDAGQLRTLLIAAPVSAGEGGQLDGLDDIGIHQVRAAAEIGEGTVFIIRDRTVFEFADELALVRITLFFEVLERFRLGDGDALEGLLLAGQFEHLLFYLRKVSLREGLAIHVHVIIEAVVDSRSDAELDTRVQGFEGFRHQVGRRVPENATGILVLPFQELHGRIGRDRTGQVHDDVVYLGGQNVGCQSRADALRNFVSGDSFTVGSHVTVRECDVDHNVTKIKLAGPVIYLPST